MNLVEVLVFYVFNMELLYIVRMISLCIEIDFSSIFTMFRFLHFFGMTLATPDSLFVVRGNIFDQCSSKHVNCAY